MEFKPDCRECPRLAKFLDTVKDKNPNYFCKPVPAFGVSNPKLLIVGLAPGMHGANKTGRPFTGDFAGILLYQTLLKFGFSSEAVSISVDDSLSLIDTRITNAVKCLPPENKPKTTEILQCNKFLSHEIRCIPDKVIILSLGKIAHDAILMALNLKKSHYKFSHGARHELSSEQILYDSYHCSKYNTQTKRLTVDMFENIFLNIKKEMEK